MAASQGLEGGLIGTFKVTVTEVKLRLAHNRSPGVSAGFRQSWIPEAQTMSSELSPSLGFIVMGWQDDQQLPLASILPAERLLLFPAVPRTESR